MEKLLSLIKTILRLPYFWMPSKWKGYRTTIIVITISVLSALQGLDLFSIEAAINQIGQLFNPNFLINLPIEAIMTYIGLVLVELRKETNTEYGWKGEECENMIGV